METEKDCLQALFCFHTVMSGAPGNKQNEKLQSSEFCAAECFAHVPGLNDYNSFEVLFIRGDGLYLRGCCVSESGQV